MSPKATKPRNARERSRTHRASGGAADAADSAHHGHRGHGGHPDARRQPTNRGPLRKHPEVPIAADTTEQLQEAAAMCRPLQATRSSTSPRRCSRYQGQGRGDDGPAVAVLCECPLVSLRGCVPGRVGDAFLSRSWLLSARLRGPVLGPWSVVFAARSGSIVGGERSRAFLGSVSGLWPPHVCTKGAAGGKGGCAAVKVAAEPPFSGAACGPRNAHERCCGDSICRCFSTLGLTDGSPGESVEGDPRWS